jgi:hypothetical protein
LDKAWDLALNSSGAEPPVSPRPFVGRWAGKLYRGRATIPVEISMRGSLGRCEVGTSTGALLNIQTQASEITATCRAHLDFPEVRKHLYDLAFDLWLDHGTLAGVLRATSKDPEPGFGLPYPVELTRRDH